MYRLYPDGVPIYVATDLIIIPGRTSDRSQDIPERDGEAAAKVTPLFPWLCQRLVIEISDGTRFAVYDFQAG
jgi:hypothetical protein